MKRNPVQGFYGGISTRYEIVNSIITLGLDRPWRQRAAGQAASQDGERWLDICCGTGDMSMDLLANIGSNTTLFMADFSKEMLHVASEKEELKEINRTLADAFNLPFKDDSFDLVTISFATRNLNLGKGKLEKAFLEMNRVLKPGGKLVNVETSQPDSRFVRALFHIYAKAMITPTGYLLTGDRKSYDFLTNSMINHHDAHSFNEILGASGFREVEFKPMLFGAVAIHSASKQQDPNMNNQ